MTPDVLVTVLSRKGSRGCPGKHTRLIYGKPLIQWTLEQAAEWQEPHRTIVSSDDEQVHRIAEQSGVPWVWQRPEPTDKTAKVPAIREALKDAEKMYQQEFPYIVDLDATAPLRTVKDIDGCFNRILIYEPGDDCLLSATIGEGRNPYFNQLEMSPRGLVRCKSLKTRPLQTILKIVSQTLHQPIRLLKRLIGRISTIDINTRQEAPTVYSANSSIYVYRRDFLLREDVVSPLDGYCAVYVMPDISYYHVDSETDFQIVEFLMAKHFLGKSCIIRSKLCGYH